MKKVIITGANGVGKSHLAARLAEARPEVPLVSFDAIKLQTGWRQRPRPEIDAALADAVAEAAWILEGGPSLLFQAIDKADLLIWLDPPEYLRAWRLALRPWKSLGRTRPELPAGNVDWPLQQYGFALRSLRKRRKVQAYVAQMFHAAERVEKRRCRDRRDCDAVLRLWEATG